MLRVACLIALISCLQCLVVQSFTFTAPANQWTGSYTFFALHASVITIAADEDVIIEKEFANGVIPSLKDISKLPEGLPKGFYVIKQYDVPESSLKDWLAVGLSSDVIERVELQAHNISLPAALVLLDVDEYPSISRARKACRKGNILIHRGPLREDPETGLATVFDPNNCLIGRVGDRVFPGDVVAKQVRMGSGYFPILNYKKPPFELPVVLQDDHFAIVNKPAGVVVYNQHKGGHGVMTVRAMLPFVLEPPRAGTVFVMRRPASVHRLDKPTSGILCIAKTKPAMVSLSRQFHDRVVKKTYMAIVNGIPQEDDCSTITSKEAFDLGVDVDPTSSDQLWQLIDSPLEEKSGITVWRAVRYVKSLHANDGYLTLVELKPKTGRYHQLRRHMAWVCQRPLVGDSEYDEGTESAVRFRERGLFLCSTCVTLEHPYYNSAEGNQAWKALDKQTVEKMYGNLVFEENGKVVVRATVSLPEKFEKMMQRSAERWEKLAD
ncbi:hypothetical protein FisN_5Hh351 [Fistulifera solaris]|uniref:Pseudouridine synthase RsuA/RluA-like domain-containing protein n=1 Tax=Fistulifera solaris TaxID=1519565 RepID=A0A1Z5JSZ0_FISSO|nr:hypothetical protein FisN_5Hh351 [Fistulifera solaris]|eukprot:GAX16972.1 hypothetical protein FisN_5Hh351 [Fistulifera solaris]